MTALFRIDDNLLRTVTLAADAQQVIINAK
jgi:hypothetical protein